jgi:DNA-binding NarL/FixJ family response regulator
LNSGRRRKALISDGNRFDPARSRTEGSAYRSAVHDGRAEDLRNGHDAAPISSLASRDSKSLLVESFDRELVVNAFRSGVRGIFCISDSNLRLLCKCLLRVADGQIWANTEQLNYSMELISEVPSFGVLNSNGNNLLTPREEQVDALVAEGMGNRNIARKLNLSEHTIKKYLFRIFEKLGISSGVELVLYAVNNRDPRQAEWLAGAGRVVPSA